MVNILPGTMLGVHLQCANLKAEVWKGFGFYSVGRWMAVNAGQE